MKNLDLTKLTIGTKVYSLIYGPSTIISISPESNFPIKTCSDKGYTSSYTKTGTLMNNFGECVLFPSKEDRDWDSYFKKQEQDQLKPTMFVLVRDCNTATWNLNVFSHISTASNEYPYACMIGDFVYCIPYKGNEHLLNINKSE